MGERERCLEISKQNIQKCSEGQADKVGKMQAQWWYLAGWAAGWLAYLSADPFQASIA